MTRSSRSAWPGRSSSTCRWARHATRWPSTCWSPWSRSPCSPRWSARCSTTSATAGGTRWPRPCSAGRSWPG
ncbi:hypothetical protein V2I01_16800 [Micromonospora sp. BRA006-A]|nr:hypothetical protein [Micromonospora sp. BRA006-A]